MSLLATGVSAVGSILGGIGKRNQMKARARALTNQARNVRQEAGIKASLALEDSDRVSSNVSNARCTSIKAWPAAIFSAASRSAADRRPRVSASLVMAWAAVRVRSSRS